MTPNPLTQYFRHPVLHVALPSQGKFYPKNSIDLIDNNQYPVLALTRQDELVFMTVTGQVNGASMASVIQSCVPNIKNAWKMPAVDIDKLLVAIKIATHGAVLTVDTQCPNCETANPVSVDLQKAIDEISAADYSTPVKIGELEIYLHPITFQQLWDNNQIEFNEEEIVAMLENDATDKETKSAKIDQLLERIRTLTTQVLSQNIHLVKTPAAQVQDPEHIAEWLRNCDRSVYTTLQDSIAAYTADTQIKPVDVACSACATKYSHAYTLDMSNN